MVREIGIIGSFSACISVFCRNSVELGGETAGEDNDLMRQAQGNPDLESLLKRLGALVDEGDSKVLPRSERLGNRFC